MKYFFITTLVLATILSIISAYKYYIYFYPRSYMIFTPTQDTLIYADTWDYYCPENNIIGTLPGGTMVIAGEAGAHNEDDNFYHITTADGKQGFVRTCGGNCFRQRIRYSNNILWYFADKLRPGSFK